MKNKTKIVVLLLSVLLLGGCGTQKYIVDEDNSVLKIDSTGQTLQTDIFCRPSKNTEAYKYYETYSDQMKYSLEELPKCSDFSITSNKTSSLWQFLFVKPLAYLIIKLGNLLKGTFKQSYLAISLILVGIAIRLIILPFNIKTQKQSKNMQKLQPEMDKINRKYAGRNDQESMILKSQEMQALYKKYKVNPFTSCILAFIQLPIFFAFLEAINKIPTIYEGKIFGWNLGMTPSVGMTKGIWTYIILVILIGVTTFFSFKYSMSQNQTSTSDMMGGKKQLNVMLYVMTGMITLTSLTLPTAIALYWISTYAFIIIQTFITKLVEKKKTEKVIKEKRGDIKSKLKAKEGMKYGKNN